MAFDQVITFFTFKGLSTAMRNQWPSRRDPHETTKLGVFISLSS